jgi:hypothetical protein
MNAIKNKIQKFSKKTSAITIALFLIASMSASIILIPNAGAHTPPRDIQLFAFVNVAPNPAGVGQSVNVGFWLNTPPATANGPYGDRYGPFTLHVIQPDGTNQTLGPFYSDDTGGTHYEFTPTQLGEYQFQMTFPGMLLTGDANNPAGVGAAANNNYVGDTILPAISEVYTLTVQQEPVPLLPNTPLPNDYWQTPVNSMNVVNWYNITGAWLGLGRNANPIGAEMYNFSSNFNPYTEAPTTAHIMWTKPEAFGGVLGGPFPGSTTYGDYYSVAQYERKYNPVMINGYLIYTEFPGSSTYPTDTIAVDLYTGQVIWRDSQSNFGGSDAAHSALSGGLVTQVSFGQVLNFVSPDQYGGLAYFWTTGTPDWITAERAATPSTPGLHFSGTTYNMFDAMSGQYILSIVNGTSIAKTVDDSGDIIGYYVSGSPFAPASVPHNLVEWNSTQCILQNFYSRSAAGWEWRPPTDGIADWNSGIMWQQTLPNTYQGNALPFALSMWAINSGVIVLNSGVYGVGAIGSELALSFQTGYGVFAGYSATDGTQLWYENVSLTPYTSVNLNCEFLAGNGIFVTETRETGIINGYSMNTGKLVWSDNVSNDSNVYDTLGAYQGAIAYNTLFLVGFGGDVWSINMADGKINWYTNTTKIQGPAGSNTPYGTWPIWEQNGIGVADGIVFLEEGHEYSPPTFLGAKTLAINATDGSLVWDIAGFDVNGLPYMAYGQMNLIDGYNNEIEDYGRGPSSTTVSAPSVGVTTATPITITGSVMDVSAGAKQEEVAARFPTGLPAVSDASMTQFMESVYMQQPMPHNVTGVPVTLSVLDANGNYRTIGSTTTDGTGQFGFNWTPDIPGNYTVIATFAGSGGYYGSSAQTYFYASEAPTTAPTSAPPAGFATTGDLMVYIIGGVIAIIIALAIATVLILRKRP